MRLPLGLALAVWAAGFGAAWGAPNQRDPHVGYVYPAGGRQGTTFRATIGGQFLNGVRSINVSGAGVRASLVWYMPALGRKQLRDFRAQLAELWRKRRKEMLQKRSPGFPKQGTATPSAATPAGMPPQPLILQGDALAGNLEKLSSAELAEVLKPYLNFADKKRQPNAQIGERARVEVSMDAGAAPGDRELRLGTAAGLTNPVRFQVGMLPEACEPEPVGPQGLSGRRPNRPNAPGRGAPAAPAARPADAPVLDLPVVLNGQVLPGEADHFRLRCKKGQHLVIEARARALIPYLADAVPGWFQAALTLRDAKGSEVAFADHYRFAPDPVLYYEIPADGEYDLEIRDSIYRGREDFVYRISVGEQPFITRIFPLGGRTGVATVASIAGWNLPEKRLPLDTQAGPDAIRQAALRGNGCFSNQVPYAVDTLPEQAEAEPNDTARLAQRVTLPLTINGRVSRPGDLDVFQFEGRAGEEVVAEVLARRLGSPLDSVLKLTDTAGRALAWNDDHEDKEAGLLTHQADSYLCARLPKNGAYFVYLSDSQNHGDESYAYRLRIGARRPDFALRATPSSLNVPAGRAAAVCMYALRKDGFDGDIELALKDALTGFRLAGGRIPPGRDSVRVTLTAPWRRLDRPVVLRLEGRARIGGQVVSRPVVPAEDMMQAFAYRHLVAAQDLMVAVTAIGRLAPSVELADGGPVRIPAGGSAQIRVKTPKAPMLAAIKLELSDPPKGVTLQDVTAVPDGLALVLKADGAAIKAGYADNLIVEAFVELAGGQQNGKGAKRVRRFSLGVLPAIPFEIVQR